MKTRFPVKMRLNEKINITGHIARNERSTARNGGAIFDEFLGFPRRGRL
jgi:hypothetical protein